ncbi:MAG: hypothetical protein IJ859_09920 [Synergistaceae bacterium]|nr:hypothetical protein [Synergistaceae bacterium]
MNLTEKKNIALSELKYIQENFDACYNVLSLLKNEVENGAITLSEQEEKEYNEKLEKISDISIKVSSLFNATKPVAIANTDNIFELFEKVITGCKELKELFEEILPENPYPLMKQGIATNTLTKLKSKKNNVEIDPMTGNGIMTWNDFTVTMKNFSEIVGFRTSTHKLLDSLLIEFTETGGKDTKITLPLKKFMELRGLKDEKTARKQVDEDLETLYNASISFTQKLKNGRKNPDYHDMRLVIDKGIKRGVIQCAFHPDFYNLMNSYYQVMPMAKKALAINDKHNPNAYYFLKEMCEHVNMNYGKSNQNLISVITFLKSTPEIPTYEEVKAKKQGQYRQLIIEPFWRDMDALEAINAIKWEFCHSNGSPLSNEELEKMDYGTFSKLLIHFELIDYPSRELPDTPQKSPKKRASKNITKKA